ncbi:MAG: adenylate/guanylate cyclase domain-containing protein [Burkholderiaceae bacterium]
MNNTPTPPAPSVSLHDIENLWQRTTGTPPAGALRTGLRQLFGVADAPDGDASPAPAALQARPLTLLMAEVRELSTLASLQPPERAVAALQRCLGRIIEVVRTYGGHLDHMAGQSLAVVFGLPEARDDDAERAAMCAVALQMALRDLNREHLPEHAPEVFLSIGIATGTALVGHLGAGPRSAPYTVLGDVVTLAAQLRALSLRGQVLVCEQTYQRCWSNASMAAPVQVWTKGRSESVSVRELVAVPSRKLKVPRQEFRRSHRVEANLPGTYQVVRNGVVLPHVAACTLRDVGDHGTLLVLSEPLMLHDEVRLSFDLPMSNYQARDVYARLVTLTETENGVRAGMEFTRTSAEFDARVRRFVQMLVAAR